jgi:drug/metabolite transporter (DMT)-like permease
MKSQFRNRPEWLIVAASFFFVAMAACVKEVSRIPVYETVFFRAFVSALILGTLMKARKTAFRAKNLPLMLVRSLSGFAAMSCNFYALGHLPFGDACTLVNTFPVFGTIFSFFLLGERPTKPLLGLIALSWAGIFLILRPEWTFWNRAGLVALLAAVFSGLVIVVIRQTHETDPSLRIAFYFTAFCAILSAPLLGYRFVTPDLHESALLLGSGILGTGGQVLMTKAYGLENVSRLAPLSYAGVVLSFVAGAIFWREVPAWGSIAGSGIVILSCVLLARLEKQPPVVAD